MHVLLHFFQAQRMLGMCGNVLLQLFHAQEIIIIIIIIKTG